ncbi:uncharacterized protein RAG0_15178 [Rhynchosporium agropyri]|uniref:Uncharacterized protein n=1 Tax=Rhynchosporium agropyri TaxID=914238 RepID=A0A1E1LJZ3_9HELO|nr:uncharacterized protein RAG0_15178 [Rhynchosporium agropyri]
MAIQNSSTTEQGTGTHTLPTIEKSKEDRPAIPSNFARTKTATPENPRKGPMKREGSATSESDICDTLVLDHAFACYDCGFMIDESNVCIDDQCGADTTRLMKWICNQPKKTKDYEKMDDPNIREYQQEPVAGIKPGYACSEFAKKAFSVFHGNSYELRNNRS